MYSGAYGYGGCGYGAGYPYAGGYGVGYPYAGGYSHGGGIGIFAIILVLFILLVIICPFNHCPCC